MNKENELYELICSSQQKNKVSLGILCQRFEPLIKKYCYYLNYEDAYEDLIEAFILIIQKIPIQKDNFKNNTYILSYIKTSIKNAYIFFNKKNQKYLNHNLFVKDNLVFEKYSYLSANISEDKANIFIIDMKNLLTEKEFQLLTLRMLKGYSDIEIAKILRLTRHAVNKQFNKLKRKIKDLYY